MKEKGNVAGSAVRNHLALVALVLVVIWIGPLLGHRSFGVMYTCIAFTGILLVAAYRRVMKLR